MLDSRLPILQREDGEIQIGLEPERGLILTRAPAGLAAVLGLLDGDHRLSEIRAAAARLHVDETTLDSALDSLRRSDLLTDRRGARSEHRSVREPDARSDGAGADRAGIRIRVIGAGRLGREVAHSLVRAGFSRFEICDPGPVDPALYPGRALAGSQAEALRRELRRPQPGTGAVPSGHGAPLPGGKPVADVGPHWSQLVGSAVSTSAITVLTAETTEVDRAMADTLLRADQPHLVLRPWLGGVLLGPLVVPGVTPCLSCLDLSRAATDPAWPRLLAQLNRRPDRPDPVVLAWAGATVAVQLVSWLRNGSSELLATTVELSPPGYSLQVRRWRIHPRCGCSWPVTAKWGA